MGLGDGAQRAIRTLRRTWTKRGMGDLQLAVVGRGDLSSLRRLPDPLATGISRLLGPQGGSREWISITPFVAPRHLKKSGHKDDLSGQVLAELRSRNLPDARVTIRSLAAPRFHQFRHFIRRRTRRIPPPADLGYAIQLTFDNPQEGPIALGYASHFGLGLFAAAD